MNPKKKLAQIDVFGNIMGEVRLKPIRLENGTGDELEVCGNCKGTGQRGVATKFIPGKNGGEGKTEVKTVAGDQIKGLIRQDWDVKANNCPHCAGAGMRKKTNG